MGDTFLVKNPGMLTTVQDLGRPGLGKFGIPVSGAMDRFSCQAANLLVGNEPGDAGLEITLTGLELKIIRSVKAAITGGDMSPTVNGKPVPMWCTIVLPAEATLSFKDARNGFRAYLAIEGGFDVPEILGSRSTHSLALLGTPLKNGEILRALPIKSTVPLRFVPEEFIPHFSKDVDIRVVLGPQDDYFTQRGIDTFLSEPYTIKSQSTRQAYRTQGKAVEHVAGADIISDAILPGAVQIPGDGQPIIMMADAQTTGGYPKIACVISPDIDVLSQVLPGQKIRFKSISICEAHEILALYRIKISMLEGAMINEFLLTQLC